MLRDFTACRILYSTQSGRAKACARRTARILSSDGLQLQNGKGSTFDEDPWLLDFADFVRKLRESNALLVLFVSTTGDGEQTDTIQSTWKHLLQKSLPTDLFQGVSFCIFSLGDRAYGPQKFCAAGRKLTVRLRQLGAVLETSPGYGDDGTANGGVFSDLDGWIQETLLPRLLHDKQQTTSQSVEDSVIVTPPHRITIRKQLGEIAAANDDSIEEWQRIEYADSYRDFFRRQCPLTAYNYYDDDNYSRRSESIGQTPPLLGLVTQNERITAENWEQDTRHLRIEVRSHSVDYQNGLSSSLEHGSDSWSLDSLPYRAGDVASIFPANSAEEVSSFLDVLPKSLQEIADCELDVQFDSSSSFVNQFAGVGYAHWPSRCTLRGWLTYCADIHSLPEREDLRALGSYCSIDHPLGQDQRAKLVSLSETKAAALYADYVLREKRSWADVLYDFDSLRDAGSKLTVEVLFGLLSPIRPRDFSIASSPSREWLGAQKQTGLSSSSSKQDHFTVELCVAIVEGTTRLGRSFHGLCSHYLGELKTFSSGTQRNGPLLHLWIRPGSFHGLSLETARDDITGQAQLTEPVMLVGAGTGVAPLRGIIFERESVLAIRGGLSPKSSNKVDSENILVFGCRRKGMDFYYEKEWMALQRTGRLALYTAFSRDQWHKIYVQQVLGEIEKDTKLVTRHILEHSGSVYIAGGPKMARAVKEKLAECLAKELDGDEKKAQQLLVKLQRMGRFSVEAWS